MVLLFTLIYGIISFGMLLSLRQNLVQSAAEGARAGAVADRTNATAAATAATNQSVSAYGQVCAPIGSGAPLECEFTIAPCSAGGPTPECITVDMIFDYENNPEVPEPPFIGATIPNTLEVSSTAQLNEVP